MKKTIKYLLFVLVVIFSMGLLSCAGIDDGFATITNISDNSIEEIRVYDTGKVVPIKLSSFKALYNYNNIVYHSSNEEVAKIDKKGNLTTLALGQTYIYATLMKDKNMVVHIDIGTVYVIDLDSEKLVKINNKEDLKSIDSSINQYYILNDDIDLQGDLWTPLKSFEGVFVNPYGKKILNMTIKTNSRGGLFSFLEDSYIDGLIFENVNVEATTSDYAPAGALAGYIFFGLVRNVSVQGVINGAGDVGGIAGVADGPQFYNCHFNGSLSGDNAIGGIAGTFYERSSSYYNTVKPSAKNCSINATVRVFKNNNDYSYYVGGIFGDMQGGKIENVICKIEGDYEKGISASKIYATVIGAIRYIDGIKNVIYCSDLAVYKFYHESYEREVDLSSVHKKTYNDLLSGNEFENLNEFIYCENQFPLPKTVFYSQDSQISGESK